jgi:PAS domain S-box-containing protein
MGDEDSGESGGRWEQLIAHVHDAVVEFELVDNEPIVRGVNRSFVDIFGYEEADIVGESLNARIVPEWLTEESSTLDSNTAAGEINYRRVERQTDDGLREFLYRGIPVEGSSDRIDGFAIYTDITELTRQERRLSVLNRILRHNLRNRAMTIAGNTSRLLADLEEPSEESIRTAAIVEREAESLRALADEAARIRESSGLEDRPRSSLDCVPLLSERAAAFRRQYPAADIDVELPETMSLKVDDELRTAIDSLLENAIEHNPAEHPRVLVRGDPLSANGWGDIYVEDDGPPIPATERDVITGEAEITPLRHGQGIGLWLVKWTTERFGGELSFGRSELGGNSVRLRFRNGT